MFKQRAVERLNQCENIVALSEELGVSRRHLYTWLKKLEPVESGEDPPATSQESTLRHALQSGPAQLVHLRGGVRCRHPISPDSLIGRSTGP